MPAALVILIRHASAGDPEAWEGADSDRPLDEKGLKQAAALAPVLAGFEVSRLLSADVLRCKQTLNPAAVALGLEITEERLLSEEGYWDDTDRGLETWLAIVGSGIPTAVCSQGGVIPHLLARSLRAWGAKTSEDLDTKKGAYWVIRLDGEPPRPVDLRKCPNPLAVYPKRP